ncbi:hypothetical protein [Paenibacillus taichungensis]|uniref:hypothetical protein n=1 Tax=Paenibacillus taichungensis TaxID=484184 RepID=UPI0039A36E6E
MARLDSYYTEGNTLVMHMHVKTINKLRYDVVVRIDKSQNTYTAIENGFEENEIIIRNEKLKPEYVESELAICIQESILTVSTEEKMIENFDLEEHINSILDWL